MLGKPHVEVIVPALATGLGLDVYDDLVWGAVCVCVCVCVCQCVRAQISIY